MKAVAPASSPRLQVLGDTPPTEDQRVSQIKTSAQRSIQHPQEAVNGYKARLIYRVLAKNLASIVQNNQNAYQHLEQQVSDFVDELYKHPDTFFVEASLSAHELQAEHFALKAATHLGVYGFQNSIQPHRMKQMILALCIFVMIMQKHEYGLDCIDFRISTQDQLDFNRFLQQKLQYLNSHYSLPIATLKLLTQMYERFDGQGPEGLKGNQLESAHLIHLALVFENMQTQNGYRKILSATETMQYLRQASDQQVSSQLVERFIQSLPIFPTGSMMETQQGLAFCYGQNPGKKLSPKLLLITDTSGNPLKAAEVIQQVGIQIRQALHMNAVDYKALVRGALEPKKPWYIQLFHVLSFDVFNQEKLSA